MFNQGIYHQSTQMVGGFVGGSGTLNYVPKWTPNGVTIGNSQMFDNGTNMGIATATPGSKFTVLAGNGDGIRAESSISGNYILLSGGNASFGPAITSSFVLGIKTPDSEIQLGRSSGTGRALIYVDSSIISGLHLSGNSTGGNAIILDTNGNTSISGTLAVGTTIALTGAELHVVGSGNTSAGFAFRVDSSTVTGLLRVRNDGYVIQSALNAAIADADLASSQMSFYLDEAGNTLTVKVKYSGGTVKTGTVALV